MTAPARPSRVRAFVAARILKQHVLGVRTVTQAVAVTDVSRASIDDALMILKYEDRISIRRVLHGLISLGMRPHRKCVPT